METVFTQDMTTNEFSIRVGDRFENTDGVYRVEHVSANGAVRAVNERTGKKWEFPGYGRLLPPERDLTCFSVFGTFQPPRYER